MKTEYIILKEAALTNNCPECYSTDGMVLSFKQKRVSSKFMVKTKNNIVENINCKKCESEIFPGQWTIDIERVYDYHKKTIPQTSGSLRFTKLFYLLLLLIIGIATVGYLYFFQPHLLSMSI
ncbi:hypothetical protein [Aquimarina aquimarini]|uniref:hypothetical protein n=1 Tax=Aquimarina aquimarini TaxID=1191734 RepID=UPI000D5614FE|nr:hypothetical protein [Aquimarina aquimarini]